MGTKNLFVRILLFILALMLFAGASLSVALVAEDYASTPNHTSKTMLGDRLIRRAEDLAGRIQLP